MGCARPALALFAVAVALLFYAAPCSATCYPTPDPREVCDVSVLGPTVCTADCYYQPISAYVRDELDGWTLRVRAANMSALVGATDPFIDCWMWFPGMAAAINSSGLCAGLNFSSCMECQAVGSSAQNYSVITVTVPLAAAQASPSSYMVFTSTLLALNPYVFNFSQGDANGKHAFPQLTTGNYTFTATLPTAQPMTIQADYVPQIPECYIQGAAKPAEVLIDLSGSYGQTGLLGPMFTWSVSTTPALGATNKNFIAVKAYLTSISGTTNSSIVLLAWNLLNQKANGVYVEWDFYATAIQPLGGFISTATLAVAVQPGGSYPPLVVRTSGGSVARAWAEPPVENLVTSYALVVCPGSHTLGDINPRGYTVQWQWTAPGQDITGPGVQSRTSRFNWVSSDWSLSGTTIFAQATTNVPGAPPASSARLLLPTTPDPMIRITSGGGRHSVAASWNMTLAHLGLQPWDIKIRCNTVLEPLIDYCSNLFPMGFFETPWTIEVPAGQLPAGQYLFAVYQSGKFYWEDPLDSVAVQIVYDDVFPLPNASLVIAGQDWWSTQLDAAEDIRIVNTQWNPLTTLNYRIVWTVAGPADTVLIHVPVDQIYSATGQTILIPGGTLMAGTTYTVSISVEDRSTNAQAISTVVFSTLPQLQITCQPLPGTMQAQRGFGNAIEVTCFGQPSTPTAGPIKYQLRADLVDDLGNYTGWVPVSGFSTINSFRTWLPFNFGRVWVYAVDQAGAHGTADFDVPPQPGNSVNGGQTLDNLGESILGSDVANNSEDLNGLMSTMGAALNAMPSNVTTDSWRATMLTAWLQPPMFGLTLGHAPPNYIQSSLYPLLYLLDLGYLPIVGADTTDRLLIQLVSALTNWSQSGAQARDTAFTLVDLISVSGSANPADLNGQAAIAMGEFFTYLFGNYLALEVPLVTGATHALYGSVSNLSYYWTTFIPGYNSAQFNDEFSTNPNGTTPGGAIFKLDPRILSGALGSDYPVIVEVLSSPINLYSWLPNLDPQSVISDVDGLAFYGPTGQVIPVTGYQVDVLIPTKLPPDTQHNATVVLPAWANENTSLWSSDGCVGRGVLLYQGAPTLVSTCFHLTDFIAFQGIPVPTPPYGELAPLADTGVPYYVSAILIILTVIGGIFTLVTLVWLGIKLAQYRTYHPVGSRGKLVRVREKRDPEIEPVEQSQDYDSVSQSDSSVVSVRLKRPHFDENGVVNFHDDEDPDSPRSHHSDEGTDEDEPHSDRSGSQRSGSQQSASQQSGSQKSGPQKSGSQKSGSQKSGSQKSGSSASESHKSSPRSSDASDKK